MSLHSSLSPSLLLHGVVHACVCLRVRACVRALLAVMSCCVLPQAWVAHHAFQGNAPIALCADCLSVLLCRSRGLLDLAALVQLESENPRPVPHWLSGAAPHTLLAELPRLALWPSIVGWLCAVAVCDTPFPSGLVCWQRSGICRFKESSAHAAAAAPAPCTGLRRLHSALTQPTCPRSPPPWPCPAAEEGVWLDVESANVLTLAGLLAQAEEPSANDGEALGGFPVHRRCWRIVLMSFLLAVAAGWLFAAGRVCRCTGAALQRCCQLAGGLLHLFEAASRVDVRHTQGRQLSPPVFSHTRTLACTNALLCRFATHRSH